MVQIAVLAIPIAGIVMMVVQLLRKLAAWGWRRTRGRPVRRSLAVAGLLAGAAVLALSWIPSRNYRPIQPGERGTQGDGLHALFTIVGGPGPLYSYEAAQHRAEPSGQVTTRPGPTSPAGREGPTGTVGRPSSPGGGTAGPGGPLRSVTVPEPPRPSSGPDLTVPTLPPVRVPVTVPATLPSVTTPATAPVVTTPLPAPTVRSPTVPAPTVPTVTIP